MAQSLRHSRWEVGLDFCLSLLVNLSVQAWFLPTFTFRHGVSFTAVFLLLSLLRRYGLRRWFNRLDRPERGQTRWMSLLEAWADTVIAMGMALGMAALWYPQEPLPRLSGLIGIVYLLTMLRRYLFRRFFEWLHRRGLAPTVSPLPLHKT